MIILTKENVTPELVAKAFDSKFGLHYETDSKKVRQMIKQHTASILNQKRKNR